MYTRRRDKFSWVLWVDIKKLIFVFRVDEVWTQNVIVCIIYLTSHSLRRLQSEKESENWEAKKSAIL